MWKGTPQDCMDHVRGAHDVPSDVKSASLEKFFSPWTVRRQMWVDALKPCHLGLSTDTLQQPWRNVRWRPRFRPARFQHAMLAPRRWSLSCPGRPDMPVAGCGQLVFVTNLSVSCLRPWLSRIFRTSQEP